MGHETKGQGTERKQEPQPPSVIPEMVVNQRRRDRYRQSDSKPERLAFDEEINVTMSIARKRAGAEKHDDADDQHRQHCQKKKIRALALHSYARFTSPYSLPDLSVARASRVLFLASPQNSLA